jgi:hypothetical protein
MTGFEGDEARHKRPTMVLTTTGIIVRDTSGLRSWQYEDIADVRTCVCQGQIGIVVVLASGVLVWAQGDAATKVMADARAALYSAFVADLREIAAE